MRAALALAALATAACFNPTYTNPTCGPSGECPSGLACVAGSCQLSGQIDARVDGSPIDARSIDASPVCVQDGLIDVCIEGIPPPLALNNETVQTGLVDGTGADVRCLSDHLEACVLVGDTITTSGIVRGTGVRPLVLVARTDITVSGVLDVSSNGAHAAQGLSAFTGAGAPGAPCDAGTAPEDGHAMGGTNEGGGAGGGGGSFGGKGGDGGEGDTTGTPRNPGLAGAAQTNLLLRGGCSGHDGGSNVNMAGTLDGFGGIGGTPGGAIYLGASGTITVAGTGAIDASGRGGGGGTNEGGGGGGGSGGLIGLQAPAIVNHGTIYANGGGGGGGARNGGDVAGTGDDALLHAWNDPASGGTFSTQGAPGGNGTAHGSIVGAGGGGPGGAGGGGGGAGYIYVKGTDLSATNVSPAPSPH